jgi:hypothetical protein
MKKVMFVIGMSLGIIYSYAQKTVFTPTEWSNPANEYYGRMSSTREYESANFVIFWGDIVGTNPATYTTDPTLAFNPQSVADTFEYIFKRYINDLKFINNAPTTNFGKYKTIVVMLGTFSGGDARTEGFAFASSYSNTIGAMFVHPTAVKDGGTISHEFTHALQMMMHIQENPGYETAFTGYDWAGPFFETHANYMRAQVYQKWTQIDGTLTRWIQTRNYLWSSNRHHYTCYNVLFYVQEKDGFDITRRMWAESTFEEHPFETLKRLKGLTQNQFNDYLFGYVQKDVAFDYPIQWDGTVNQTSNFGTAIRGTYQLIKSSLPRYTSRQYTLLDKVQGSTDRFYVNDNWAPQDYGINIIPLYPTCTGVDQTVSVKFKGHTEVNPTYAGWRYGFVTTKADGTASRYSPMYSSADGEASFDLNTATESNIYLVVFSAPTIHGNYNEDVGYPKTRRYPYELKIANAVPEGYQAASEFRKWRKTNGSIHSNGGGWVSSNANVASTVYVGPYAMVLGGTVSGNARIDNFATVEGGNVSGNAIVRGNACIYNATISGSAIVEENAWMEGCSATGNANLKGNMMGWAADYGNSVVVGGDAEIGSCSTNGVYLQTPYWRNGRTDCDGLGATDISNIDINATYSYFTDVQMNFGTTPTCTSIVNPTVTITSPANASLGCAGQVVTITATAVISSGSISKIDFYDGSILLVSDNSSPYSYTWTNPATGAHSVKAIATSSAGVASIAATISITINALPTAPTVTTPVTYCQNATATALTAIGTNLKWYAVSTGGTSSTTASVPITTTTGTTNYYVSQTTNTCEGPRATIAVIVNALPVVTPNVQLNGNWLQQNTAQTCSGSTILLGPQPTSTNGWTWTGPSNYTSTTRQISLANITTLQGGVYTANYIDVNGCKSSSNFTITVNATPTVPTVTNAVSYCHNAVSTKLTATGAGLLWYSAATGGTGSVIAPIPPTTTTGTTNYYVSQTTNTCEGPRAIIAVTINATPTAPTVTSAVSYCQNAVSTKLTATGAGLLWYSVATGGIGVSTAPVPATTNTGTTNYYVSQTTTGCESARSMIAVTVSNAPTASITTISPTAFCTGGSVVLTASVGSSYKWFINGTTQVGTTPTYSATVAGNYTVEVTNAGNCKATSSATSITVNALPSAPAVIPTVTYCQNGISNQLTATGTGLLWYTTATGGMGSTTAPTPSTTNTGSTNYYVSQTTTGCESSRSMISVTVIASPIATITASGSTNIPQGGSVVLTSSIGSSYKWFNGAVPVGTAATYTATVAGVYTVEVTSANNCSATSSVMNVNLNSNQPSVITITSPTNNSQIQGAITITATATNPNGSIVLVEYLDGNTVIGTSTSVPYSFVWNTPTPGDHEITVRVTDSNGGITTSAPITVTSKATPTGLFSNNSNSLNGVVYPNPANAAIFIDSDSDLSDASFMLVDVLGNEHSISQTSTGLGAQIDVSNLSSGTYVLIIKKDDSVMRKKITVIK